MAYLIKRGCSTRRVPDPKCPDFLSYRPGDIVAEFPDHVPLEEWIKAEVIAVIDEAEPRKTQKARQ